MGETDFRVSEDPARNGEHLLVLFAFHGDVEWQRCRRLVMGRCRSVSQDYIPLLVLTECRELGRISCLCDSTHCSSRAPQLVDRRGLASVSEPSCPSHESFDNLLIAEVHIAHGDVPRWRGVGKAGLDAHIGAKDN